MEPTTEDLSVFNAEESPIRYLSEDEEEVSTKDSSEEEERPAKNFVTGKDFAKLTKKARKLGAESLDFSPRKNNICSDSPRWIESSFWFPQISRFSYPSR